MFPWRLLAFPVNLYVGLLFTLAVVATVTAPKLWPALPTFNLRRHGLLSLSLSTVAVIVMGLVPQDGAPAPLALRAMTSSWLLILPLAYLTFTLGVATVLFALRLRHRAQLINNLALFILHLGIYLTLLMGPLSSADRLRLKMTCQEGQAEWRATDPEGPTLMNIVELPLAVQLERFVLDEYPPKLLLTDSAGNNLCQPYPLIAGGSTTMGGFAVTVDELMPSAALTVVDSAGAHFAEFHSRGATWAAKVAAVSTGEACCGYVSCGNAYMPPVTMPLPGGRSLRMAQPEPKRFCSLLTVYQKGGPTIRDSVEVNHPLDVGPWTLYQVGYDRNAGRWSDITELELVHDPGHPFVYCALALVALGFVILLVGKVR